MDLTLVVVVLVAVVALIVAGAAWKRKTREADATSENPPPG